MTENASCFGNLCGFTFGRITRVTYTPDLVHIPWFSNTKLLLLARVQSIRSLVKVDGPYGFNWTIEATEDAVMLKRFESLKRFRTFMPSISRRISISSGP